MINPTRVGHWHAYDLLILPKKKKKKNGPRFMVSRDKISEPERRGVRHRTA